MTTLGQEALIRYCNGYQREDLENALRHFECAWSSCSLSHPCRAAVLVNFAKTKFLSHQIDPNSANFDQLIPLYREALDLRHCDHPDRPATLLQLAQILLFRYEKQGCHNSVADMIHELTTELLTFPENCHERRAADLILDTLERCRVVNSGSVVELDQLVQKLQGSAIVPPDGYFDKPQRLINLSIALWRRYEKHGQVSDLECSAETNEQALELLQGRHLDRLPGLRTLAAVLWALFQTHGDFNYLIKLSALTKEALQLIPEGHPECSYWVTGELLQQQSIHKMNL